MPKEINVKKWDKSREPYNRDKIVKTMLRYGLNNRQIKEVSEKVEAQLYDGITTKKILSIVKDEIEKSRIQVKRAHVTSILMCSTITKTQ